MGLITLVAIAAVAIAAVTIPSVVIIHIAAAVTFIITVFGLTFIYNILTVLIVTIIIVFFSQAVDKIVKIILQRSNITEK